MALQDPSAPWAPGTWDDYINAFQVPVDIGTAPPVDPTTQQLLPGELAKHQGSEGQPLPPPPPTTAGLPRKGGSTSHLATPGAPVQDEVPQGAPGGGVQLASPEEIEIDQPMNPPLLGEVDAVSGVGPQHVSDAVDVTGVDREQQSVPTLDASNAALPSVREREDQQSGERYGVQMAGKSPEEQAMFLAKIQQSHDNFAAARALEESNKAAQQAHDLARVRDEAVKAAQARRVQLEGEAKKIADTDPASTIPGYKKLFGVLAAFVGGFAANKTGRNMGLEIVDSIANDAAQQQAQKLGVVNKQIAGVGDDIAAADSAYHNGEAVRVATYDSAIKALQSEVQLYDPKGSTAARVMQTLVDLQARRSDALAKYGQTTFDNQLKAGELAVKTRHQGLEEAKYLTDEQRKAMAAAAGTGVKQSPEFWEAYSGGKRPPFEMSQKEFNDWLATAGKVKALNKGPGDKSEDQLRKEAADADKAQSEAAAAETGYALKNPETGEVFRNPDGSPVVEMDATKRNRASGIVEAAANIRRLADRMAALKKKYGGAIDSLGSDEAQEIKNLASMVDFETFKAFDLGAPSEGDKALAEGVRGGVSPTSFIKNATAGFQAYADNVERKANTALHSSGYKGPTLHFHREADVKQAKPTVVDEIGGKLTSSLLQAPTKGGDPLTDYNQQIGQAIVAPQNKETDALFQQLAAYAEQSNDQGDLAKKYLRELSEKSVYPDAKARAKSILDGLPGAHVRGDESR